MTKSETLSQEVAGSQLHQEAWRLQQQLTEVTASRDEWRLKDQEKVYDVLYVCTLTETP